MANDYDDRPMAAGRPGELGPLDKLYRDTNFALLIVFSVCCAGISFILSLIAFLTAKDVKAKSNAKVALIVSIAVIAFWFVINVVFGVGGMILGGRR